jgi:hypothetical protein
LLAFLSISFKVFSLYSDALEALEAFDTFLSPFSFLEREPLGLMAKALALLIRLD